MTVSNQNTDSLKYDVKTYVFNKYFLDKKYVWHKQCSGVQGTGNEEVKVHTAALWDLQDRLGLVDTAVYVLYSHHCAVQRCIHNA